MSGCAYAGSSGGWAGCRPGSHKRTSERTPEVRNFEIGKSGLSIGSNNGRALAVFDNARKGNGSEPIARGSESGGCVPHGDGEVEVTHHVVEGRVMEIPVLKTRRGSEGVVFHGDAPVGY